MSHEKLTLIEWKVLKYLLRPHTAGNNGTLPSFTLNARGVYMSYSENLTADAKAALRSIAARGWTDVDGYGNNRVNAAGRAAFDAHPEKPIWTPPAPPKLQDRDFDVLGSLDYLRRREPGWGTPLDCGGTNGSHHSASLVKLTRHGYAAARQRNNGRTDGVSGAAIIPEPHIFHKSKGSREFRITEAGIAALKGWAETKKRDNGS